MRRWCFLLLASRAMSAPIGGPAEEPWIPLVPEDLQNLWASEEGETKLETPAKSEQPAGTVRALATVQVMDTDRCKSWCPEHTSPLDVKCSATFMPCNQCDACNTLNTPATIDVPTAAKPTTVDVPTTTVPTKPPAEDKPAETAPITYPWDTKEDEPTEKAEPVAEKAPSSAPDAAADKEAAEKKAADKAAADKAAADKAAADKAAAEKAAADKAVAETEAALAAADKAAADKAAAEKAAAETEAANKAAAEKAAAETEAANKAAAEKAAAEKAAAEKAAAEKAATEKAVVASPTPTPAAVEKAPTPAPAAVVKPLKPAPATVVKAPTPVSVAFNATKRAQVLVIVSDHGSGTSTFGEALNKHPCVFDLGEPFSFASTVWSTSDVPECALHEETLGKVAFPDGIFNSDTKSLTATSNPQLKEKIMKLSAVYAKHLSVDPASLTGELSPLYNGLKYNLADYFVRIRDLVCQGVPADVCPPAACTVSLRVFPQFMNARTDGHTSLEDEDSACTKACNEKAMEPWKDALASMAKSQKVAMMSITRDETERQFSIFHRTTLPGTRFDCSLKRVPSAFATLADIIVDSKIQIESCWVGAAGAEKCLGEALKLVGLTTEPMGAAGTAVITSNGEAEKYITPAKKSKAEGCATSKDAIFEILPNDSNEPMSFNQVRNIGVGNGGPKPNAAKPAARPAAKPAARPAAKPAAPLAAKPEPLRTKREPVLVAQPKPAPLAAKPPKPPTFSSTHPAPHEAEKWYESENLKKYESDLAHNRPATHEKPVAVPFRLLGTSPAESDSKPPSRPAELDEKVKSHKLNIRHGVPTPTHPVGYVKP